MLDALALVSDKSLVVVSIGAAAFAPVRDDARMSRLGLLLSALAPVTTGVWLCSSDVRVTARDVERFDGLQTRFAALANGDDMMGVVRPNKSVLNSMKALYFWV